MFPSRTCHSTKLILTELLHCFSVKAETKPKQKPGPDQIYSSWIEKTENYGLHSSAAPKSTRHVPVFCLFAWPKQLSCNLVLVVISMFKHALQNLSKLAAATVIFPKPKKEKDCPNPNSPSFSENASVINLTLQYSFKFCPSDPERQSIPGMRAFTEHLALTAPEAQTRTSPAGPSLWWDGAEGEG